MLELPPGHDGSYRGPVIVHARERERAEALCGTPAGWGAWSRSRKAITCEACRRVIEERLEARRPRRT
jgi:hypothetical protein